MVTEHSQKIPHSQAIDQPTVQKQDHDIWNTAKGKKSTLFSQGYDCKARMDTKYYITKQGANL